MAPRKSSMVREIPQLRTPGVIANELGEPLKRVLYVLRTRGHNIRPIGRAGILRLYDQEAVSAVGAELLAMSKQPEVDTRELHPGPHPIRRSLTAGRVFAAQRAERLGLATGKKTGGGGHHA